jgi:hypothetical protein
MPEVEQRGFFDSFMGKFALGAAPVGLGIALCLAFPHLLLGWIGLALCVLGLAYWMYELFTGRAIGVAVPGMLRFVFAIMLFCAIAGLLGPKLGVTLPSELATGIPTQAQTAPFITMKIHPSAFPVSVPARTTLHILPLHPFQTFTDTASQLHEYDNECSTDRPWPSRGEIASKPANAYEEVRDIEVTNHGPGIIDSGDVVFEVRYKQSFAGGCLAASKSDQNQEDVISIPTLDQGQTFSFVSVNQTDRCAWLLPPDKVNVKMVGERVFAEVPLRVEGISVPNWIGTPFGPTSIKWQGVPTKNPGYGIVRSGAVCEAPKTQKSTGTAKLEGRNRSLWQTIVSRLSTEKAP